MLVLWNRGQQPTRGIESGWLDSLSKSSESKATESAQ